MRNLFITSQTVVGCFAACLLLSSCFKDEPLNAECDITEASVHVSDTETMFFNASDTLVKVLYSENSIRFNVRRHADLTALAPTFRITPGASISPASGSVHDFSQGPVTYLVTSEDKKWSRRYEVAFIPVEHTVADTLHYDFEHFDLDASGKYYTWSQLRSDGTLDPCWDSGNSGFSISLSSAQPDEYPTVSDPNGFVGSCVRLTTRDTGPFGRMAGKRIAAGNLFLGSFDVRLALKRDSTLKATRFGKPFAQRPLKMTGYYQYTPGDRYQDADGNYVANRTDSAAIYAVLFRNHDADGNALVLYGDNVQTSPQIVAIAKVRDIQTTSSWTPFEVMFDYRSPFDETLSEAYGYSLTVVFSSSHDGDLFEGAIGSTLLVDQVSIICSKTE